jgi:hypothetical protein
VLLDTIWELGPTTGVTVVLDREVDRALVVVVWRTYLQKTSCLEDLYIRQIDSYAWGLPSAFN